MADIGRWKDHQGTILDSVCPFDVIDCAACGFAHVVPIPSTVELAEVYRHDYYATEKPLYLQRHQEDLEWWNLVYSERYDRFEELLPTHRRRILDIGSGPGYFLSHGRDRGWHPSGIEPSSQAVAHSRELGLDVMEGFFDDESAASLGSYDVMHLSQVLEHIPDPRAMLRLIHAHVAPGGMLCIVVPNDYNQFQRALRVACGYQPWWVAPPHHINYFSFDTLASLVTAAGFEVVSTEATFPMEMFLLMGDAYVGNDALGRACHGRRKALEMSLARAGASAVKRQFYCALAQIGIGREVVLYATRE